MENKNLPATVESAVINYDDRATIETLKQTVAVGFTDAELAMFIGHCRGTRLNPFKREIWGIKANGKVQILTGINGYYEIANRHPAFDGIETEIIEEGRQIVKAIARVYRKDRSRPTVAEAYLSEYGKPYGNWKTMPRLMLSKCAESMALRKSFPQELNGTYTVEEMPREYSLEPQQPETKPEPTDGHKPPLAAAEPSYYRLQSGNKRVKGKTLAEVHAENPKWIAQIMAAPKVLAMYAEQDRVNIAAYAAEIAQHEQAAATKEVKATFDADDMPEWDAEAAAAEADKILAGGFK